MLEFEGSIPKLSAMLKGYKGLVSGSFYQKYKDVYKYLATFVNEYDFQKPGRGLYLYGMNGSGKTWSGIAVANELQARKGVSTARVTSHKLLDMYYEDWKIPSNIMEKDVVVLDEFNKDIPSKKGYAESVVEIFLKERFEEGKVTIIASNSGLDDIERRYGPTVVSVLKGRCWPIRFPNNDLRLVRKS